MNDMSKQYCPQPVEKKWSLFWEHHQFFSPSFSSEGNPYCITLPPPNVTGTLHMGHALVNTLQDLLVRWRRMCGDRVLWIPGTDHAGISTQTVVERELIRTRGKTRKEFSREAFLKETWKWKEEHEMLIIHQLKRLGCSCDWSRWRFTMDEGSNRAVRTLFKKMYEDHLIYQGNYLINWDPVTQTALADDEVEYEERQTYLWHISYPFAHKEGSLTIATTRPETLLGDVAVAVSPQDPRYQKEVGKELILPICHRAIPIISDSHVNPNFGTGVVKITPAHDFNDYEIGQRHHLPLINLLNPDGTLNENGGEYAGLSMEEARHRIVCHLKEKGLLLREEPYLHRLGISYRSKAAIEPFLSQQWFINMTPFKQKLIDAVEKKRVQLIPKEWEKHYLHWIYHLRDWCISRQLWWGHRLPIWKKVDDPQTTICYGGEGLPPEVQKEPKAWKQDDNVLDTWFSSAIWPLTVLGWPDHTELLDLFYPNSILLTGHDILFFWVARMIMIGEYLTGEVPFHKVSLQGLIYGRSYWRQDKQGKVCYISAQEKSHFDRGLPLPSDVYAKWEKMSKSKGNIVDPLNIIEEYGTDGLRMALISSATQNIQIDLDCRRFEEFKNFANKIWNGFRFVMTHLTLTDQELVQGLNMEWLALEDRWILLRFNRTIETIISHLHHLEFDQLIERIYLFFWNEFCAYYLEIAKPILFTRGKGDLDKQRILITVLVGSIRLLHPMAPFITEEIFHEVKKKFPQLPSLSHPQAEDLYTLDCVKSLLSPACAVAPFPQPFPFKEGVDQREVESHFTKIQNLIYTVRNMRAEMNLPPQTKNDLFLAGKTALAERHKDILFALLPIDHLHFHSLPPNHSFYSTGYVDEIKVLMPIPSSFYQKERERLEKEEAKARTHIAKVQEKLNLPHFIERAPQSVIDQTRQTLADLETRAQKIQMKLKSFTSHESTRSRG